LDVRFNTLTLNELLDLIKWPHVLLRVDLRAKTSDCLGFDTAQLGFQVLCPFNEVSMWGNLRIVLDGGYVLEVHRGTPGASGVK
jgi:hypothetical protein